MRSKTPLVVVGSVLVLASLACNGLGGAAPRQVPTLPPLPTTVVIPPPVSGGSASDDQTLAALYQRVDLSVVAIRVDSADAQVGSSLGSGFVYDTDGHIVTNHHVIANASNIEVDFPSGLKVHGQVVGSDVASDLAVVQVEAPANQLVPLPLADSDQVQVGQHVIAIGNPFGLNGTMTEGIVSGLGRALTSDATAPGGGNFLAPDIIQTDAAINPGNSGGPLIDLQGQVVGVNQSIESPVAGVNSGIGFAVAANTVRQIVPYLIKDGKFAYPYLGLTGLSEVSLTTQEQLKLPQSTGIYVTGVTSGGPADKAGIQADSAPATATQYNGDGDMVVALDGHEVKVFSDMLSYLINHTRPNQAVTVTLLRGGKKLDVTVTLAERPQP